MSVLKNVLLVAVPLGIVALVAGGAYMVVSAGDDDADFSDIEVAEGRVSCDMFAVTPGYKYQTQVILDLKERPADMEPTDGYRAEGFTFTTDIVGDVNGTDSIYANVVYPEQPAEQQFIVVDDRTYRQYNELPWEEFTDETFSIPYIPGAACNAIAPDLFLDDVEGTPEAVRGIEATKYHFDALETDFPDRLASFGPGSDAAVYVNTFAGDIWVANEGGYIVAMDLLGVGHYDNGRELEIYYKYELYDVGKSIDIKPPI